MASGRSELRPCACALEGVVMAQRGSSRAAAGQRARACSGAASGWQRRVLCRARREGRVSEGERERREKKGVEREI